MAHKTASQPSPFHRRVSVNLKCSTQKCFIRNKSDIINLLIFIFSIFCFTYKSWSNNGCCDSKVWSDDLSNSLHNRHRYWNNCNPPLLVIIIRRMFEDVAAESRGVGRWVPFYWKEVSTTPTWAAATTTITTNGKSYYIR